MYSVVEALRTEWFRSRQRYTQLEEELKILKREMVMTVQEFGARAEIWGFKSRWEDAKPGMAEYAVQKSWFYSQLQKDAI